MKYQSLILFFSLIFLSCQGEDPSPELLPPTDLNVKIKVSDEQTGVVQVTASASNAEYFEFEFGEIPGATPVRDSDGVISYTYEASGSYTVVVRAHANEDVFVESSKSVTVTVKIPSIIPDTGYSTPESYDGFKMVWQDEFDGDALNADIWTFELGTGSNGWGNNELQYYRKENTTVGEGYLMIEAKKESFGGSNYTSSRIITKDNKAFKYGRIDIRAALPEGQGIWPALWMLGSDFESVGWPACGEIDIMEMIGGSTREKTVHGTTHWEHDGSYASYGGDYSLTSGIFADEFHVFSIIWDETFIKWYVDDVEFHVIDITPGELSEFHQEFFFIFNVAVGGNWPGNPDGSTSFPQRMIVDYVRVFQEN